MANQNKTKGKDNSETEKIIGRIRNLLGEHDKPLAALSQLVREMTPIRRPGRKPGPLHDYTPHLEYMGHLIEADGKLSIRKAAKRACSWAMANGLASVSPQTLRKYFSKKRAQFLSQAAHDSTENKEVFPLSSINAIGENPKLQQLLAASRLARIPGLTADGRVDPRFYPVQAAIQRSRQLQDALAPSQIASAPPRERLALQIQHLRSVGLTQLEAENVARLLGMFSQDPQERRAAVESALGNSRTVVQDLLLDSIYGKCNDK